MRHPILARRTTLAAYLLAWVPFGGLMAVLGRSQGWTWAEALTLALAQTLTGAFLVLSAWYLCRALPLERALSSARWVAWSVDALMVGLVWAGMATFEARLLALIPAFAAMPFKVSRAFPVLWALGALFQAAGIALHYLLLALERSREAEKAGQALKALAQEAELKALRAQINPHFLFNSLNSISALTSLDPARARTMCVLLSDFLRITLGLGERPSVSL
ncbi:MAG TPA: histidine kinase, partial [Holophagaceae bacterium]|nr:histidine kinase [Holophagaceae bacterium]